MEIVKLRKNIPVWAWIATDDNRAAINAWCRGKYDILSHVIQSSWGPMYPVKTGDAIINDGIGSFYLYQAEGGFYEAYVDAMWNIPLVQSNKALGLAPIQLFKIYLSEAVMVTAETLKDVAAWTNGNVFATGGDGFGVTSLETPVSGEYEKANFPDYVAKDIKGNPYPVHHYEIGPDPNLYKFSIISEES